MENKIDNALLDMTLYTKQLTYQGRLRVDPHELLKNKKAKRRYWCVSNSSLYLMAVSYKDLCDWREKQIIKIANDKCNELNAKLKSRDYRYVRYTTSGMREYDDMLIMEFSYTIQKAHHREKQYRYQVEC